MNSENELERAIRDISMIRQVLDRGASGTRGVISGISNEARKLRSKILIASSILAGTFGIAEILTANSQTKLILLSKSDVAIQRIGIFQTALGLFVLCSALFVMIMITAKKEEVDASSYIERYFSYLNNLGLFSDLLVKFIVFSLFIISGQGQWIAPLLFIFTGDYLLQGRIFIFPVRTGIVLGMLCLLFAGIQFYLENPLLVFPCLIFALISCFSIVYNRKTESLDSN